MTFPLALPEGERKIRRNLGRRERKMEKKVRYVNQLTSSFSRSAPKANVRIISVMLASFSLLTVSKVSSGMEGCNPGILRKSVV